MLSGVLQLVLKETFTDGGSTSMSAESNMADPDKQDTVESPHAAPDSAQPAHDTHMGAAGPAGKPKEASAMEGVEGPAAMQACDKGEGHVQHDKPEKVEERSQHDKPDKVPS